MKTSAWLFGLGIFFFAPVAIVYGFLTEWQEWVGLPGILLVGGMTLMIGVFLWLREKKSPPLASDDLDGEISDEYYEYGFYSPWSWWPLVVCVGAAICFAGIAIGWWILPFGGVISVIGMVGLIYEYDRGVHAH
ncbi:cytochrome c oxidase subunit 4 [Brevibacterium album]|uniref:cytochrome c oxidase subunit 4 n=1 Tax=Brevibacterium album TaxID=417948 RepID=UPI0004055DB9|nr:cytochrome c oxidase subunit 4 [Brevibacterium album]